MSIQLRKIDDKNWKTCAGLEIEENQRGFLPSNAYSIAESKFLDNMTNLGIYNGDTMVGFASYVLDEDGDMNLTRLMIDKNHQNMGYGKEALMKIIEHIKRKHDNKTLWLSIHPRNITAIKLYQFAGFEITKVGFETVNEIFMKLDLEYIEEVR